MSDTTPTTAPERDYGKPRQKVPPFARFKGTSAWKKYRRRAREFTQFQTAERARQAAQTPSA